MSNQISLKRAAIINAVSKYATVIVNLLANAILARILTPKDYGVVAIITLFSTFFSVFSDMGIGSAVIQDKTLTKQENIDIFSWTVYLGIAIASIFAIFSFAISDFYNNKVYIPLGFILSIAIFFNTLNMVPTAILMKDKHFIYVGIRNIIAAIFNFLVTLILGLNGFKAYSVVWGNVVNAVILFFLNIIGSKLQFKILPRWNSLRKILGFSMYQFFYSIVNYLSRNLDNLLTGKFLGDEALGYYDKAYKLMLYPINNFTQVINPVIHPILSEHKDNIEYIYQKYIQIVEILTLVGAYVSVICFFGAREIIHILYGEQWGLSIQCFQILSLTICVQMVSSSAGTIYQSLGNTKMMFYSGLSYMVETVICIVGSLQFKSIIALSYGVMIALFLKFIIEFYFLIKQCFNYSLLSFYKIFFPYIFIIIGCSLTLYFNSLLIEKKFNDFISIFEKGIIGTIAFLIMLLITKKIYIVKKLIKR